VDVAEYQQRLMKIQSALKSRGLDAIVVVKPEHVRYVTGFWGYSTRPEYAMPRRLTAVVLPASGAPTLIVPKLELYFAQRRTWLDDVRHHVEWAQPGEVFGGIALLERVLREKGLLARRIGLELGFISAQLFKLLSAAFEKATLDDASGIVEEIRMVKSPREIDILRLGGRMAVQEYEAEAAAIRAGVREFEIAMRGRDEALRLSAQAIDDEDAPVPVDHPVLDGAQIITSGPRLDMVHGIASARALRDGDMVLLDFCRIPQAHGYRIGFARNVALRKPTNEETERYEIVQRAYRTAVAMLRPGIAAEEPDLAARAILDNAGIGETFVHRTGRGVGLEGVERPEIGAGDKTKLQPGMVVTIEPSIYYSGFAAHVEDTFLITAQGAECLTECPRDLRRVM
jgi:Xaa-Pro aminopeptidase